MVRDAQIKAKEYLRTFQMDIEELRAWLVIDDGELPTVNDLSKRAIDVAKDELDKKADLSFTYQPTKTGYRITGWTFKVKKNHPRPVQRQLRLRDQEPEHTPQVRAKGLAALADCKRELNGSGAPVARVGSKGSRV